jgi:hypothetical protein
MISNNKGMRYAQLDNCEPAQGAVCIAPPSVSYNTASLTGATDPFAGKTNKYAESPVVRVSVGAGIVHVKFGDTAPTATTGNVVVNAYHHQDFVVDPQYPYMSIINNGTTTNACVTEIY